MIVRGAPAIGVTAAYGVVLAARKAYQKSTREWQKHIHHDLETLASARPTAVNLAWALTRMRRCFSEIQGDPVPRLLEEATAIHQEDIAANQHMGELGAALIDPNSAVLTHCNAGALATGGYGTALGVIRTAYRTGKITRVFADETRPWLQGARLTAWELHQEGIPVSLLADGASAYLLSQKKVSWVIVGADRITANGDVANKIGTLATALAARHFNARFMVVAPISTIDMTLESGQSIPIEQRNPDEILHFRQQSIAPQGVEAWNPVFDITPAGLVDVLVTERGVVPQPNRDRLQALFTHTM